LSREVELRLARKYTAKYKTIAYIESIAAANIMTRNILYDSPIKAADPDDRMARQLGLAPHLDTPQ
jgi:hypothetical protein